MRKDGGPAFPRQFQPHPGEHLGMSLRDWFAGKALAGLLAGGNIRGGAEYYADVSYRYADAMLAERDKAQP